MKRLAIAIAIVILVTVLTSLYIYSYTPRESPSTTTLKTTAYTEYTKILTRTHTSFRQVIEFTLSSNICSVEPRRLRMEIKIVVLVDNYRVRPDVATAWGLSIYVETPYTRFLFDTGPSPDILEENAGVLGIDLSSIDFVVISHEHGDHCGGIKAIAKYRRGIPVYIPSGSSPRLIQDIESLGLKPIEVRETIEVSEGVYILKPLYGPPPEIAVAIETPRGLVVLVGCSHPGIVKMVKHIKKELGIKIYAVIGGFHLFGASKSRIEKIVKSLIDLGVEKIYPLHCSGDTIRRYLETKYPEHYGDGGTGLEIVIVRN